MERYLKNKTGITLIALIITVVIMLILAGVAIGAIANGDGLFEKTKEASEMYEQSSQNENEKIQELINEIDKYFSKSMDKENPVIIEAIASETWGKTSSITVIATDSGSVEQNNGIIGYGINQSSTIEPTYTSCDATTTATLTATGEDAESRIGKYEFYVDGTLYNTVTTSETSTSITLTFSGSSHSCMVKVYDMAENCIDSNTITVTKHVHTDACYSWTTKTGYVRWVDGPGAMTGDYTVECNLCGSSWTDWEGLSIGDEHCTQKVRGSLICGK